MRQVDYIFFHCTAGPQTQTLDSIKGWWKQLGWKRVGYHFLIFPDGTVVELQDISLPTNGVKNFNANSIHIAYVGGVTDDGRAIDNRTDQQKSAQKKLAEDLSVRFPNAVLLGHRDVSPDKNRNGIIDPAEWMKTCPSFSVKQWLKSIGFKAANKEFTRTSTTAVNVRSGAGTQFSVIRVLQREGTPVERISNINGWSFCQAAGLTGWIKSELLISID